MATIRASCTDCGDVDLTTEDVQVRVCTDDNSGSYLFRCPRCRMTVVKSAEQRTVDLLVSSGVVCQMWRLPAELHERAVVASPLVHDDLLDFHDLLADDDRFASALLALTGD